MNRNIVNIPISMKIMLIYTFSTYSQMWKQVIFITMILIVASEAAPSSSTTVKPPSTKSINDQLLDVLKTNTDPTVTKAILGLQQQIYQTNLNILHNFN